MFVNVGDTTVGGQPTYVVSVDVDGDGDLDLAVASFNGGNLNILLNNGAGVFAAAASSPLANNGGAFGLATADVNGDGDADLLATTHNNGRISVHLGDGAAAFASAAGSPINGTGAMTYVAVGDLNEDGDPDFVAVDGNNNFAHVFLGGAGASFSAAPGSAFTTSGGPGGIAIGDVDGDGNLDVLIAAQTGEVDLFTGNGDGTFDARVTLATPGGSPRDIRLGDLDGDGDLDAVVTRSLADQVTVLLLDGAGGVSSSTSFAAGTDPIGLQVLDVNFDGRLDIAVAASSDDEVVLLMGDGAGGFAAPTTVTVGSDPRAFGVGDFNDDGHADLAVVNQNAGGPNGSVSILLNTGFEIAVDAPAAQMEGDSGTVAYTFTVTRFGSTAGAVTVDWAVSGSGGASPSDFVGNVLPSGTVSFANGVATQTITVQVTGDLSVEANESFTVTLSNPSGGLDIATASATGVIVSDEAPPPTGTPGNDFVVLDSSGTTYSGAGGNDEVYALDGADTVNGNQGNDLVNGGAGNDVVRGGKGDDQVLGEYGDDRLFGDLGNDRVNGGPGSDTCEGNDGDDQVRGGQGDDSVLGGAGDDFVSGDRGNDTLAGGSGADWFHIFAGAGADRVTDFSAAEGDRVWVAAGTAYSVSQSGADTVVTLSDGTTLTLLGVAAAGLGDGWIFTA